MVAQHVRRRVAREAVCSQQISEAQVSTGSLVQEHNRIVMWSVKSIPPLVHDIVQGSVVSFVRVGTEPGSQMLCETEGLQEKK